MRKLYTGMAIGLVIGVVLGVSVLTPKLKTHAASKAVLTERDLEQSSDSTITDVPSLKVGNAIHWKSAPPFPTDRPNVTLQARDFAKRLSILSGESVILPVLPAKEVIAPDRLFAALASGRVDAMVATAELGSHEEPALRLFSALPFGPTPEQTLAWMQVGAGLEKLRALYNNHNIEPLICGYLAPESGGWFINELTSTEQLKTLRIRIDGLGAKVWEKLGATIQNVSGEQIANAFDADSIDAAVFSTPAVDSKTDFAKFAKNYYFPGWQNQGQPLLLLVNQRAWKRLGETRQQLIKAACDQHTVLTKNKAANLQFNGLSDITKQGVTIRRTPAFLLARLNEAWEEVLAEEIRKSPEFLAAWEDLNDFLTTRSTWEDLGYVKKQAQSFK